MGENFFSEEAKNQIREAYPPLQAISDTGRAVKMYGNTVSILCPSPNHHDRHFGNCKITSDGRCFCHACGRYFDSFNIIMDENGVGFHDAVTFAAEKTGLLSLAEDPDAMPAGPKYRLLTRDERDLLGFKKGASNVFITKGCTDKKPGKGTSYIDVSQWDDQVDGLSSEYLTGTYMCHDFLRELAFDNPEAYRDMVRNKAFEIGRQYRELSLEFRKLEGKVFGSALTAFDLEVELLDQYKKADKLYREFGGRRLYGKYQ